MLRAELERLSEDKRFRFHYTVDRAITKHWAGFEGLVTKEMIRKVFPHPSEKLLMTYCGSKAMRKHVMPILDELGYNEDLIAKF